MVRKSLKKQSLSAQSLFNYRGVDNTRIEALSDGVFAIATALLIISSSIPETFAELKLFLKDLVPFAICMVMLMLIWYQHYVFFIRYGFKDAKIVAINTLLLFLILFYIYPLKFLMQLLYDMFGAMIFKNPNKLNYLFTEVIPIGDGPELMIIYGSGACCIFFTLALMYGVAYFRKDTLALSPVEIFLTKSSMITNIILGSIPLLSCLICMLPIAPQTAFTMGGMIYWINPAVMIPYGIMSNKKLKKLAESEL